MTSNAKAEGRFDKSDLMSKRDAAFRLQPAYSVEKLASRLAD